jgi:hypothetical protein
MIPTYKKNLKQFCEYYLTDKDNRIRAKEIAERKKSQSEDQGQN